MVMLFMHPLPDFFLVFVCESLTFFLFVVDVFYFSLEWTPNGFHCKILGRCFLFDSKMNDLIRRKLFFNYFITVLMTVKGKKKVALHSI